MSTNPSRAMDTRAFRRDMSLSAHLADAVAMIVIVLVFVLGFFAQGFAGDGMLRSIALIFCAILGCHGLAAFYVGRWSQSRLRLHRILMILLLVLLVWTGLQLLPLPASLVSTIIPPWGTHLDYMAQVGVVAPLHIPLGLAPEAGATAWNLFFAAVAFFAGASVLVSRTSYRQYVVFLLIGVSLVEGIFGLLVWAFGGSMRGYGALYNPNHHAAMVIAGIPVALAMGIRQSVVAWHEQRMGLRTGPDSSIILYAILFVAICGWLVSFSRGSLLLGGGVVLMWLLLEGFAWQRRRESSSMTWLIGGAAILLMVVMGFLMAEGFASRSKGTGDVLEQGRVALIRATFAGLAETNFLGLGLRGAGWAINRHFDFPTRTNAIHTHNDPVQWVAEIGIPVTFLVICLCIYMLWRLLKGGWSWPASPLSVPFSQNRALAAGLLSILAHSLADFHLRVPMMSYYFLLMLAVFLVGSQKRSN